MHALQEVARFVMFDSSLKCSKLGLMGFWGPGNGQESNQNQALLAAMPRGD